MNWVRDRAPNSLSPLQSLQPLYRLLPLGLETSPDFILGGHSDPKQLAQRGSEPGIALGAPAGQAWPGPAPQALSPPVPPPSFDSSQARPEPPEPLSQVLEFWALRQETCRVTVSGSWEGRCQVLEVSGLSRLLTAISRHPMTVCLSPTAGNVANQARCEAPPPAPEKQR